MSKIISPVQTIEELIFINNEAKPDYFIPLDLEPYLYCIDQKIPYIELEKISDNHLHLEIIQNTDKYLNEFFNLREVNAFERELVGVCRFYLHLIFFIQKILHRILGNNPIANIIISGWQQQTKRMYAADNYQVSRIVEHLFPNKINKLSNIEYRQSNQLLEYCFEGNHRNCDIILEGLGYNFKRFLKSANSNKLRVGIPNWGSVNLKNWFKSNIYRYENFNLRSFNSDAKKKNYTENLNFDENDPIYQLLITHINEKSSCLQNEENKCVAVEQLLDRIKPKLVSSVHCRGVGGHFLENSPKETISLCIPHGTVTATTSLKDQSYRRTIAEAVFTGKSDYVAQQSKLTVQAYNDLKPTAKPCESGNLIFEENLSNPHGKSIILYAVTHKNFYGMQFYGVETFYEFLEDLRILEKIQDNIQNKVFVKLHPAAQSSIKQLSDQYPKIVFSQEKLSSLLNRALVTISFSSTVIEDSLYSKVPVILFDQWKRYQHCPAELDPTRKDKAVYYINRQESLLDCLNTIQQSTHHNFEDYTFAGNSSQNFNSLLNRLL